MKNYSQESRNQRTLARPSVDYTDDEDIENVSELPQAESTAEENKDIPKRTKQTKKSRSYLK